MAINLGLCCLNKELSDTKRKTKRLFCSRSCTRKTFKEKGLDLVKARALENIKDILPMMIWNELNGIRVFRLSSDLFPHFTDSETEDYTIDFAFKELREVGEMARKLGHRITFHPGQFNVLGTEDESKLRNTIKDLKMHAHILDIINAGNDSVMVIHGGGLYKKKNQSLDEAKDIVIERWCNNYNNLPDNIKSYLVLENCEKCFSTEDYQQYNVYYHYMKQRLFLFILVNSLKHWFFLFLVSQSLLIFQVLVVLLS